jgi:NitT/TauT family transport system permease protein
MVAGLIFSNSKLVSAVFSPFIVALNAVPRIALIPIIILITGPTFNSTVISAAMIVFFLVFYNAFAGGRSVPTQVLQHSQLLGANPLEVVWQLRLPYVAVWTVASLPSALALGLIGVVTTEILTGRSGIGQILVTSIAYSDSTTTFCVVVLLAILGVLQTALSEIVTKRILHWWEAGT